MTKDDVLKLVGTVEAVRDKIFEWTYPPVNNGPFLEEAYRTNAHIASALNILSDALRALAREMK